MKYALIDKILYWKDPGGMLLKCLDRTEEDAVTAELHGGACGGHRYWKETTYNILRVGYYFPTLFNNVYFQERACIECQKFEGKNKLQYLPLKPITSNFPLKNRSLDFL